MKQTGFFEASHLTCPGWEKWAGISWQVPVDGEELHRNPPISNLFLVISKYPLNCNCYFHSLPATGLGCCEAYTINSSRSNRCRTSGALHWLRCRSCSCGQWGAPSTTKTPGRGRCAPVATGLSSAFNEKSLATRLPSYLDL